MRVCKPIIRAQVVQYVFYYLRSLPTSKINCGVVRSEWELRRQLCFVTAKRQQQSQRTDVTIHTKWSRWEVHLRSERPHRFEDPLLCRWMQSNAKAFAWSCEALILNSCIANELTDDDFYAGIICAKIVKLTTLLSSRFLRFLYKSEIELSTIRLLLAPCKRDCAVVFVEMEWTCASSLLPSEAE